MLTNISHIKKSMMETWVIVLSTDAFSNKLYNLKVLCLIFLCTLCYLFLFLTRIRLSDIISALH